MKILAVVLNWLFIAFAAVASLLTLVRFQNANGVTGVLVVVPFAAVLGVYHLKPNLWIALLSLLANAMGLLVVLFFAYEAHAVIAEGGHDDSSMMVYVVLAALAAIFLLNIVVTLPALRAKRQNQAG
jgi:hypothetical protein